MGKDKTKLVPAGQLEVTTDVLRRTMDYLECLKAGESEALRPFLYEPWLQMNDVSAHPAYEFDRYSVSDFECPEGYDPLYVRDVTIKLDGEHYVMRWIRFGPAQEWKHHPASMRRVEG